MLKISPYGAVMTLVLH